MDKTTVVALKDRAAQEAFNPLEAILREGAQNLLRLAIEEEVAQYIDQHANVVDMQGHRVIVRNGHLPERELITGIGPISVQQPRVRDHSGQSTFSSRILPRFMRRLPSVDAVIPVLYLKGVSTGNFSDALAALLGKDAPGLSATNVVRLKEGWLKDYVEWSKRPLSEKEYVYWWADGIYFNVRLDRDRPCMLVLMGALADGTKELVAVWDGERESKASWLQVLRDLKRRGVTTPPKLAVGDGALGFWAALEEAYPGVREQRCWVHKTANILDKLPKRIQPDAKKLIHEMYMASTREQALEAYGEFVRTYKAKYPKAVECLVKDKDVLFAFYDFPAEHWLHIRTTNPIESTFATVRHRTRQTKGCGSRMATLTMVFKLAREAERYWRKLNGHQLIAKVIEGVIFIDGVEKKAA